VRPSLFSQSLFALSLEDAIETTARIGFEAIELACVDPHFGLGMARREPDKVAGRITRAGLDVSALSLFNTFTDPAVLGEQIKSAETFIGLAPAFDTQIIKMTPGPPASAAATAVHWGCLAEAVERLVAVARDVGVRIGFETHMRQVTDTLASSQRLLDIAPADVVGLTVDFSNLSFAGERMDQVIGAVADRLVHTHLKNGTIDASGGWHFDALDRGLTDYAQVLRMLHETGYDGYLSIECLGADAGERPAETARRDLAILRRYLQAIESPGRREVHGE